MNPNLLGATDAALLLGISRKTLTNYRDQGLVPYAMRLPSGHYRYARETLLSLRKEWNEGESSTATDSRFTNPV